MGGAPPAGSILGGWGEHGSPGGALMDHPGRWFFLSLIVIVFHAPPPILEAVERHLPPPPPPHQCADPDSTTIKISQQIWPLFYYSKRQKLLR